MTHSLNESELSSALAPLPPAEKLQYLYSLVDHFPVAIYVCDETGALRQYNEQAARLWGWLSTDVDSSGLPCTATNRPFADERRSAPYGTPTEEVLKSGEPVRDYEFIVNHPDGRRVVLLASAEPIRSEEGSILGVVGCLQDITERRRVDLQQKELLNELNHRVKNTLATVQLLAGLTIQKCGMPREVQNDFEGRLIALSRAHDQVTRGRWEPVDLHAIIQTAIEPYCVVKPPATLQIRGESISVGPQASVTLAMIFHELASNAAKYGALSSSQGCLSVSWSVANGVRAPTLIINWQESGGPPVSKPGQLGFGSRLVEHGIVRQFKGAARLDYDPSGLRCTMEIPLPSTPE